ncbi:MAG: hypothetical protein H8E66_27255 [Planctomycetes bacterium]|nr:hypothetical protein [Planctomycetota bacterium]
MTLEEDSSVDLETSMKSGQRLERKVQNGELHYKLTDWWSDYDIPTLSWVQKSDVKEWSEDLLMGP